MSESILKKEPATRFRASVARGAPEKVSRGGGMFKAGVIRQTSIIMRGEALGHGAFVDEVMLDQVAAALKSAGSNGIKARFTHPGMSSDGLGKYLGKFKTAKRDGDKVLADLHFAQSAHETPDGDLASYIMGLAEEAPEDFGISIVFERDFKAEEEFRLKNTVVESDDEGYTRKRFVSPDGKNAKNFTHVRLKRLRAADVVDTPAANEDGLFSEGSVAEQATSLISFALGLTDEEPEGELFSEVHPNRIKGFVARWMESEGYELKPVESERGVKNEEFRQDMSKDNEPKEGEVPKQNTPVTEPKAALSSTPTPVVPEGQRQVNSEEFSEFEAWKQKQAEDKFNSAVAAQVKEQLTSLGVIRQGEDPATPSGGKTPDDPPAATPYGELYQAEVEGKRSGDRSENLRLAQAFRAKYGTQAEYNQKHNLTK